MTTSARSQTEGPDIAAIASQNDAFRKLACFGETPSQPIRGRMHLTSSLAMAEDGLALEAVQAVGEFDVFEPESDPDGCHDFGAVDIRGQKVFWKIDLYEADSDFRYGAEAPDNPATTVRVLTIMMASDW